MRKVARNGGIKVNNRSDKSKKFGYRFGFRMLTLGWSGGSTFLPVNSILLSSENKKNRVNEAAKHKAPSGK